MPEPMSDETLHGMEQNAVRTRDKQRLRLIAEVRQCWARIAELTEALEEVMSQFAYWAEGERPGLWTGGLSALEAAFGVLGWENPHPAPELQCDEPGCKSRATCGFPTPDGYRRTCGTHYRIFAAKEAPNA